MESVLIAQWYRIPGYGERRLQCSAIGCIMYAAITDGNSKALCVQHATPQAMQADIVLRAMHSAADHDASGRCAFCGGTDWRYEMSMHQCNRCWPQGSYKSAGKQMVNVSALPMFQGDLFVPVGRSVPKSEQELARQQKYTDGYLSWRGGGIW